METGIYETIDPDTMDRRFDNIAYMGKEVQRPLPKPGVVHFTIPWSSLDSGYYNTVEPEYLELRNLEQTSPWSEPGHLTIIESGLKDKVHETLQAQLTESQAGFKEMLQSETIENSLTNQNGSRFLKMENSSKQQKHISHKTIIILVVIGFVIFLAVGTGVGWYFGVKTSYGGS